MKFTRDGRHLMTLGRYDENGGNGNTGLLGGPAGIWVDPETNEAFIADGYRNRRVIVFDGDTGAYLWHWGAYPAPEWAVDEGVEVPDGHGDHRPVASPGSTPREHGSGRGAGPLNDACIPGRSEPRPDPNGLPH